MAHMKSLVKSSAQPRMGTVRGCTQSSGRGFLRSKAERRPGHSICGSRCNRPFCKGHLSKVTSWIFQSSPIYSSVIQGPVMLLCDLWGNSSSRFRWHRQLLPLTCYSRSHLEFLSADREFSFRDNGTWCVRFAKDRWCCGCTSYWMRHSWAPFAGCLLRLPRKSRGWYLCPCGRTHELNRNGAHQSSIGNSEQSHPNGWSICPVEAVCCCDLT